MWESRDQISFVIISLKLQLLGLWILFQARPWFTMGRPQLSRMFAALRGKTIDELKYFSEASHPSRSFAYQLFEYNQLLAESLENWKLMVCLVSPFVAML